MDLELKDKVAIVTGGTQGIGRATAMRLAREGARVVIAARGRERLDAVAAEIRSAGGAVAAVQADVGRPEDCERLVAKALEAFGRIDILVNNAGLAQIGIDAPSSVLARMAESVQRLEYDRFVTVLCVRVGSKDTLEYANAGHPSGFVLSKDHTIVDLPSTGTVVHPMLPERSWPSRTARFVRGDRLVIYSDGLVEAMGKDGVYGVERLKRVVERQTGAPRDVVESIVGSVTAYVDGRPLDDDLTLLVAERARSPQRAPS